MSPRHYDIYIDGGWSRAGNQDYFPAINPYTQEHWAYISQASDGQVADAIAAARHAYETGWKQTSGYQRAELLNRLADILEADAERMGRLESTDNGKVVRETQSQMKFAARQYRFFAGYADKLWGKVIPLDERDVFDFSVREPLGVAVLITAWNSPMGLLSNKLAPALAAGNCVVVKPSEHASATTLEFAELVERAGFPKGVFNVVTGDARVGRALLTSGRVDRISFTGSPGVGREIAANAARVLTPVTLELGGKSPNIVFDDADLGKAVVGALAGIFAATGQTCVAGSRLLVQRGVHDRMVAALAERAQRIRLGDPTDLSTEMGTAANQPQFERILQKIAGASNEGARLVAGGAQGQGRRAGAGAVHRAHHLRRRRKHDGDCAGGSIRPRPVDNPVRDRGRSDRSRQRDEIWAGVRHLDDGSLAGLAGFARDHGRDCVGQHIPRDCGPGSVRRLQG